MKFLDLTKKLIQQIVYYDTITKNKMNFFNFPTRITIIWIEDED